MRKQKLATRLDKLRYIGNLGLVPGVEFTLVSRALQRAAAPAVRAQ